MPKRKDILKKIEKAAAARTLAFTLKRSGGNHDIYSLDGLMVPVGRHAEFTQRYAEIVYKECEAKLGKGWWR